MARSYRTKFNELSLRARSQPSANSSLAAAVHALTAPHHAAADSASKLFITACGRLRFLSETVQTRYVRVWVCVRRPYNSSQTVGGEKKRVMTSPLLR